MNCCQDAISLKHKKERKKQLLYSNVRQTFNGSTNVLAVAVAIFIVVVAVVVIVVVIFVVVVVVRPQTNLKHLMIAFSHDLPK